jgi:hypothetical protein
MLVVRDVRSVFNSLVGKHYGSNGTTAEEPPLRMRLRRFKEDWEMYRDRCPMLRYESLVAEPEQTLRKCCDEWRLPWDQAMLDWPKEREQIADPGHGNMTFRKSRGGSFAETADPTLANLKVDRIPPDDLEWLQREFADFNRAFGYPQHAESPPNQTPQRRAIARYENTKRYSKEQRPLVRIARACTKVRDVLRGH